jgi:hypothetical protein
LKKGSGVVKQEDKVLFPVPMTRDERHELRRFALERGVSAASLLRDGLRWVMEQKMKQK